MERNSIIPNIAMTTVLREGENYLHRTLDSLSAAVVGYGGADLCLCRGDDTTPILAEDGGRWPELSIHETGMAPAATRLMGRFLRHRLNYISALSRAPLVMEDDIEFHPSFVGYLNVMIGVCNKTYPKGNYILDLFTKYNIPADSQRLAKFPADGFYGLQCIYYPEPVRRLMLSALMTTAQGTPTDMIVKDVLREHHIDWLFPSMSLVEHIGYNTTGLSDVNAIPKAINFMPCR